MIAFLALLLGLPKVLAAADAKAALVIGCPGALRHFLRRVKMVKCIFAAVAIIIVPPFIGVAAAKIAGLTRVHV